MGLIPELPSVHRRIILLIIGGTILLSLVRFQHEIPLDSQAYIELTEFFQGTRSKQELQTPWVYRPLVPWLASTGPVGYAATLIATVNVLFTIAAYLLFYSYLISLKLPSPVIVTSVLLLVFSFPTVNYSSSVMTDGAGFFFFTFATLALLRGRLGLLIVVLTIGVFAREATLILLLTAAIFFGLEMFRGNKKYVPTSAWFIPVVPILAYLLIRWYFSDLPSYFWRPSLQHALYQLARPVQWIVFGLTILPPIGIYLFARRSGGDSIKQIFQKLTLRQQNLFVALAVTGIIFNLYSVSSAVLSGRFVWPYYTVIIPFVAWSAATSRLPASLEGFRQKVYQFFEISRLVGS